MCAIAFGYTGQCLDQFFSVDDAGIWRVERDGRYNIRLDSLDEIPADYLQSLNPVLISTLLQRFKSREFPFRVSHDEFSNSLVRDAVLLAELIEQSCAANAM